MSPIPFCFHTSLTNPRRLGTLKTIGAVMNGYIILWALNVLLQVTCVSALGIAIAGLVHRHATAKYWVLCSALLLILLSPLISAVMQRSGRTFISVEVSTTSEEVNDVGYTTRILSDSELERSARLPASHVAKAGAAFDLETDSAVADDVVFSTFSSATPDSVVDDSGVSDWSRHDDTTNVSSTLTSADLQRNRSSAFNFAVLSHPWLLVAETLISLWLGGATFLLARMGVGWWRLRRILNRSEANVNPAHAEILTRAARELQLRRMPELLLSFEVAGPVSAGLLSPRIVLPARLTERVSPFNLHHVLVHEVAHVLRRDQWTVLLQNVAGAIYWCHPLVIGLNRGLAQSREEVCDNYVLATTNAESYSRTLLTLAELIAPRKVPGTVGLFTSHWKLEHRVAGLLHKQRNRGVRLGRRAKLLIVSLSLLMTTATAMGTVSLATGQDSDQETPTEQTSSQEQKEDRDSETNQRTLLDGPTLRGEGGNREMLLRGRVVDVGGEPVNGYELVAIAHQNRLGQESLPARIDGSDFEVWVPVSGSQWLFVELSATAADGRSRAIEGIGNRELRQAAIEGIDLKLKPTQRDVTISVTHGGAPVANAFLNVQLVANVVLHGKTDGNGEATIRFCDGETPRQITAWTDDFRIGGFSFGRKPRRDPLGAQFTVELHDCRDQQIRFVDEANSPVPNVPFELVMGTGRPNYNFVAVPDTFPHCHLMTDDNGEAVFRWFPDWETHGAYVEIVDPRWATAVRSSDWTIGDDGALVMSLKRRIPRKPIVGTVTSDRYNVGGLLVEIKSFQGEEAGRSDHVYAFTDEAGNFRSECIPGATYTVCVNDGQLLSNMIDLIPYELDTGNSNFAKLNVSEGNPIEIRVTAGPRREPMRNQSVYVRQEHDYTWMEDGKKKNGTGARDYPVYTDERGVARAWALAGSKLRITIYAGEWRSEDRHVTVKDDGVTLVEFHRQVAEAREVKGRLLTPPNLDVPLAGAEIIYGSIGGETDEREQTLANASGHFAFHTKAIRLGIFAYTPDGRAAGVAKPESLDLPIQLQLQPTMDLHGQLLGDDDEPLAHHAVRVQSRVIGKQDFNKSFATSFRAKTFETRTDQAGNYTLKNLPTNFHLTLWADPLDESENDVRADDFYLVAGDERPRMVSRLGRRTQSDERTLAEKHDGVLRSARLDDYRVLVLCYHSTSREFVNAKLLDHDAIREVSSFLNLRIEQDLLTTGSEREFADSKNWPQPKQGTVFMCALAATGEELGRIQLDTQSAVAAVEAAEFIRKHAPPQLDATAKWDAAFAEAQRSGRRVWARIGQRYCGPCFRLSRWLDDHHELLERDYVLLKIDNVRDKHGVELANRIVSNREHFGVPFHAIFDANERLLVDSESPVGNIGHPSSFEGRRHLTRMLRATSKHLTEAEISQIVGALAP